MYRDDKRGHEEAELHDELARLEDELRDLDEDEADRSVVTRSVEHGIQIGVVLAIVVVALCSQC